MKGRPGWGVFFITLGVIIFLSALVTCIKLNIGPSHGLTGPTTAVQSSIEGSTPTKQSNVITSNGNGGDLVIRLRLQRLDMSSRELTSLIDVKVSDRFKKELWDSSENTTVADSAQGLMLKAKYENYMLPLEINECSSGYNMTIQMPLKDLFIQDIESCPQPSRAIEITIPVTGRPQIYPDDWYLLNANFSLLWNGTIFPGTIMPPPGSCTIPPEIEVYSGLSNKQIVMQQNPGSCSGAIKLLITSGDFTRVYTWTIVLIPIILFFIFIHVLYVDSETRRGSISNLIAGVIAAIIAVLPLRIVLVPAEISGLTRVDLILALGMVSIFALAITTYGLELVGIRKIRGRRIKN